MSPSELPSALVDILGSDRVLASDIDREAHSGDRWFASALPDVVVEAQSTEDVSRLLQFASEHSMPVTPRGAGVGYVGGCVPLKGGISLSLAKMNRILEILPRDGVAVVQPGVITGTLQAEVAKLGWFYPPDPASLKECSLGGNLATNAGGPRCLKYGVTRHYALGLKAVLASGEVVRWGGKCHKNKTGFDLGGLLIGSEGTLGVITEATLRLIPMPRQRAMISCGFGTFTQAAEAVQLVLSSGYLPSALEITDKFVLEAARSHLGNDVAHGCEAHLLAEIDGSEKAVAADLADLKALLLEKAGGLQLTTATTEAECEALWTLRREFSYSLRATGLTKLNEDVVVPRGRIVDLAIFAEQLQHETGIKVACFGHAGDGNLHVNLMVDDMDDPGTKAKADEALDRLFRQILDWGGAITGEHGVGIAKKRWFRDAVGENSFQTHLAIKKALDPAGILNPGKFLG